MTAYQEHALKESKNAAFILSFSNGEKRVVRIRRHFYQKEKKKLIMNKCVCEREREREGMDDWMLSTCLDYQRRMGNVGVGNNTQIFNIYKWTYRTWQTSTLI